MLGVPVVERHSPVDGPPASIWPAALRVYVWAAAWLEQV